MTIIYSKLLKAYLCFKICKTHNTKSLLACKRSRIEAINAGLERLPFKLI